MTPGSTDPTPVQVHLGISDGIFTEITDGLHDGDIVVDSILVKNPAAGGGGQQGGGFGMRRPF
jgi:hypothetical protein